MMKLAIHNLSKTYGKRSILDQLSLEIDRPGIWALIGPNGAGKTTLLDCIANLQTPDQGSIDILGLPNTDRKIYQKFAYLQDNRILYPELTGLEHLKFVQKAQGLDKERTAQVIEEIGIADYVHRPVKSYSLGMKQHLLLALGIMIEPELILLDEPLNGLDPASYIQTRNLLLKMAKNGSTIIVSSHHLNEVDQLTDQLLFLKNGKLIERSLSTVGQVYQIDTSDNQLAFQALSKTFPLYLKDNLIQIDSHEVSLDQVMRALTSLPIQLLSIHPVQGQAERLYTEIFGEEKKE
ncbi:MULTISPECIES: ABC transporter ATP-binding protein [Streptococcus]|uniref:ABC transporter ATP-binding protein n=1 Tax=Streptococcus suivaginalis TaxID=3028082 RepID=A0AA96VGP7_9STRE|nr:ABC transporter ATP-binding protein [Streptococcus sp. 29896]WNY47858.1 ABC transporter ATP-binding protein [Streptococcus sp. 29896]